MQAHVGKTGERDILGGAQSVARAVRFKAGAGSKRPNPPVGLQDQSLRADRVQDSSGPFNTSPRREPPGWRHPGSEADTSEAWREKRAP